MEITPENVIAVLKQQIMKTQQALEAANYRPEPVRERVAALAQKYGQVALDVGTGACACMAVALVRSGLKVTAVDHASSAVRLAEEHATGKFDSSLDIRHLDAKELPFSDNAYHVVTAFDALCHTSDPDAVLKEMYRVGSKAIIITELNDAGRKLTKHLDEGFVDKFLALLPNHCQNCQLIDDDYHLTILCQKVTTEVEL